MDESLYKSFYEKAAEKFNDQDWIPHSIVFSDLHEDFKKSKPLPLNVAPITAEQFNKKNHRQLLQNGKSHCRLGKVWIW